MTSLLAACRSSVQTSVVHLPRHGSEALISLQLLIPAITKSIPVTPSLHMSATFLFQALIRSDGRKTSSVLRIQWLKKMVPSRKLGI
jgi:hypothetical protein